MRYFLKIFKASPKVELSGYVGPEAMISRSSPITSERISDRSELDLFICRRSWPPLTADRCFLTAFISWIDAPERRSELVIFCLSAKEMPDAGKGISADPPPE